MSDKAKPIASQTIPQQNGNPRHLETVEQAYAFYAELKKCPVYYSDALGGFYWLTQYKDVRSAALNKALSSEAKGVLLPPAASMPRLYAVEQEEAAHQWARQLYAEAVTPDRLVALEPELERAANQLIDAFASTGVCDLVEDFTDPLPVMGVSAAIGFSVESVPYIKGLTKLFGTDPDLNEKVIGELGGLLLKELLPRREEPRDDYLSLVANAEFEGRKMDEVELARFMFGFMHAGHHTTTSALGSLLFHILSRLDLRERILEDERTLAACVEEIVRLHPPFHAFHRTTTAPFEIGAATIPAGATVRLNYASANRDETVFENPEAFDPDRKVRPHLGFGFGRHVCVGAPLARVEMKIAVRTLLTRLPDIRIVEPDIEFEFEFGTRASPRRLRAAFTPPPESAGAQGH